MKKYNFHALLNNFIECFKDSFEKSDGTNTGMLTHLDLFRLNRCCMVEPEYESHEYETILKSLQYGNISKLNVIKKALRVKPRGTDKNVIYFGKRFAVHPSKTLETCSFMVIEPREKIILVVVLYDPKTLCIENLYSAFIKRVDDKHFDLQIVEDQPAEILKQLLLVS